MPTRFRYSTRDFHGWAVRVAGSMCPIPLRRFEVSVFTTVRSWTKRLTVALVLSGPGLLGSSPAGATIGANDYPYANSAPDAVDVWNLYTRECTSFVAWRLNHDLRIPFSNQYRNPDGEWGDAEHWDDVAASVGIAVDGRPTAHSVAVWHPFVR